MKTIPYIPDLITSAAHEEGICTGSTCVYCRAEAGDVE